MSNLKLIAKWLDRANDEASSEELRAVAREALHDIRALVLELEAKHVVKANAAKAAEKE